MARIFCICIVAIIATFVSADESEVKIDVVHKPDGKPERLSKKGDLLVMHYTGTLENGQKFDSSHDHGEPFEFQLGVGQVIQGWEKGLLDMCIGEKRKLVIPPELGYGDQGAGESIPPKSVLHFEVELINIKDGPKVENIFSQIDADKDNKLTPDEISNFIKLQTEGAGQPIDVNSEEHTNTVNQIFQHEDKDRDGVISHEEFSGPKHDEL